MIVPQKVHDLLHFYSAEERVFKFYKGGFHVETAAFYTALFGMFWNAISLAWLTCLAVIMQIQKDQQTMALTMTVVDVLDCYFFAVVIVGIRERRPNFFLPYLVMTPIDLLIDLLFVWISWMVSGTVEAVDPKTSAELALWHFTQSLFLLVFHLISLVSIWVILGAFLHMKYRTADSNGGGGDVLYTSMVNNMELAPDSLPVNENGNGKENAGV